MQLNKIFLLAAGILIFSVAIGDVSATEIFLTSDCISCNKTCDVESLNIIAESIEKQSEHTVKVDPLAPKPGEWGRAVSSAPDNGVAIYLAASCPGAMMEVAKLASVSSKGVIFINTAASTLKKPLSLEGHGMITSQTSTLQV
ncbi:putative protein {ECO:0000313/EMBL:AAB84623,1} [Methanothermobacter wolfeii]|uniref:hypothetical protein n=1 Tax=Methanothermobacter wolfeii TaxID=145261 RepID=UPI00092DDFFD|nr:putative protein {ECO:0000313/EMBL:AAB84623,1} [Methanothermobacter wolfeii]